jgi:hypothetical protein
MQNNEESDLEFDFSPARNRSPSINKRQRGMSMYEPEIWKPKKAYSLREYHEMLKAVWA